jgi:hypothetical protein
MPNITDKLLKMIIGEKEEREEEETSEINEPKYKNTIKKWFKVPDVVNNLSAKMKGSKRRGQPKEKSVKKPRASKKRASFLKERPWKKWLEIIILVITSTFIFYGLLWQFGILKY